MVAATQKTNAAPQHMPSAWQDYACREEWCDALLAYLRENWRGQHGLWAVVNAVAAEALPECRGQTREYTREVLNALMDLIRQRRVMRYRRRWIAALDVPLEIVPLDRTLSIGDSTR